MFLGIFKYPLGSHSSGQYVILWPVSGFQYEGTGNSTTLPNGTNVLLPLFNTLLPPTCIWFEFRFPHTRHFSLRRSVDNILGIYFTRPNFNVNNQPREKKYHNKKMDNRETDYPFNGYIGADAFWDIPAQEGDYFRCVVCNKQLEHVNCPGTYPYYWDDCYYCQDDYCSICADTNLTRCKKCGFTFCSQSRDGWESCAKLNLNNPMGYCRECYKPCKPKATKGTHCF